MWETASVFAGAKERVFAAGETVFRSGETVAEVYLVLSGETALVRSLPLGEQVLLQRASQGDVVAEASVYAPRYHCDCIALEATSLAIVPRPSFLNSLRADVELSEAWAAHLAKSVQRARMRAEIRSLKTVAQRLDAWVAEYGELPEKGTWQTLASELSVSKEALYRELAKRR
ncbi:MAG: Crp/Fnr family transcriptional regulator [Paracoccaceae bacterium]